MLTDLSACEEAIDWFVENCKDNCSTEEAVDTLIKSKHKQAFEWSNWLMVRLLNDANKIKYAVFAARKVLPTYEGRYPDDLRPRLAIEAAEKFISDPSEINKDACAAAARVAGAAAHAAYAADADYAAAADAADAADAARAAARAAYAADAAYAACAAANADINKKIIQYGFKLIQEQQAQ